MKSKVKPRVEDQAWIEEVSDTAAVQGQSNSAGGHPWHQSSSWERARPGPRLLLFAAALINYQADLEHSQLCFKALEWE